MSKNKTTKTTKAVSATTTAIKQACNEFKNNLPAIKAAGLQEKAGKQLAAYCVDQRATAKAIAATTEREAQAKLIGSLSFMQTAANTGDIIGLIVAYNGRSLANQIMRPALANALSGKPSELDSIEAKPHESGDTALSRWLYAETDGARRDVRGIINHINAAARKAKIGQRIGYMSKSPFVRVIEAR